METLTIILALLSFVILTNFLTYYFTSYKCEKKLRDVCDVCDVCDVFEKVKFMLQKDVERKDRYIASLQEALSSERRILRIGFDLNQIEEIKKSAWEKAAELLKNWDKENKEEKENTDQEKSEDNDN